MKKCTKCNIEKLKSEFYPRKDSPDGLRTDCKTCTKIRVKGYINANRERHNAYSAISYRRNIEARKAYGVEYRKNNTRTEYLLEYYRQNKDKKSAYGKAYYADNKDRIAAYHLRHRKNNTEAYAERNRRWSKANPEKRLSNKHSRRAREAGADGFFTPADITHIFQKQDGKCVYCQCELHKKFHRDHIIAISEGGSNWPSNIQLLCGPCNISKGTKSHDEFVAYRLRNGIFVPPELLPEYALI